MYNDVNKLSDLVLRLNRDSSSPNFIMFSVKRKYDETRHN